MITQFHVKNYKALRDVTLPLTQIHVLIGPNDSGKTSILEAIAALCRSVDFPLNQILPSVPNPWELRWYAKGDEAVALAAEIADGDCSGVYSIGCILRPGADQPTRDNETWTPAGMPPISVRLAQNLYTSVAYAHRNSWNGMDRGLAIALHDALRTRTEIT